MQVTPRAATACLLSIGALAVPAAACAKLPPLPRHWPKRLQLGLTDGPGGAAALRRSVPFGFRYQYLAGGVNTGQGWATWNDGGTFVDRYVRESAKAHVIPVFSYYMIRQSLPGANDGDEPHAVLSNLRNKSTMRAWFADVSLFMQRAGRFPKTRVVLQVEPDMWGYGEQAASGDRARTVPVAVASSGAGAGARLPDDMRGLARAVVRLRNRMAPNVILAYHASDWGTQVDLSLNNPSMSESEHLGDRAGRFYRSLGAAFDVTFTDWSDRDVGFKRAILGAGSDAWWDSTDRARARSSISPSCGAVPRGRLAAPGRQHRDARDEQRLGPLPGQPRAVAARAEPRKAPEGARRRRCDRVPVRRRRRRDDLRLRRSA